MPSAKYSPIHMFSSPRRSPSPFPHHIPASGGVQKSKLRVSGCAVKAAHTSIVAFHAAVRTVNIPRSDICDAFVRYSPSVEELAYGRMDDHVAALRCWVESQPVTKLSLAQGFVAWYMQAVLLEVWKTRQASLGVADTTDKSVTLHNFCSYMVEVTSGGHTEFFNSRERSHTTKLEDAELEMCRIDNIVNTVLRTTFARRVTATKLKVARAPKTAAEVAFALDGVRYVQRCVREDTLRLENMAAKMPLPCLAFGKLIDYVALIVPWISAQPVENQSETCRSVYLYLEKVLLPIWRYRQWSRGVGTPTSSPSADTAALCAYILEVTAAGFTEFVYRGADVYRPEDGADSKDELCDPRLILRTVLRDFAAARH